MQRKIKHNFIKIEITGTYIIMIKKSRAVPKKKKKKSRAREF